MDFEDMDFNAPDFWDKSMGLDKLGLYYHAHINVCMDENFIYSVYFEAEPTEEKLDECRKAVGDFLEPFNEKEMYVGYIDVTMEDDKITVFLDLGNTDLPSAKEQNDAIKGILIALNNVGGIKSVILNEWYSSDF